MRAETAINSDEISKQRSKFLSTINVEDMEVPKTISKCKKSTELSESPRKHSSRACPRPRRSRSSPMRAGMSGNSSPERRTRSPSVSATRLVPAPSVLSPHTMLYKNNSGGPGAGPSAMSFFSPLPPSMPLYIVPVAPNHIATTIDMEKVTLSRPQAKTKKKLSRKIVRHLLESILNKLPINTENLAVEAIGIEAANKTNETKISRNRSVAVQALSKHACNRKVLSGEEDEYSSCKSSEETCPECVWAGSVRALRDSHVRLVLQQLRQLQDIERLNRALRRDHVEYTVAPN